MKRRETAVLAIVACGGGLLAGRLWTPAPAVAADGAGGREPALVGFQFVPARRQGEPDLLLRAWDDGDFEYLPVSRDGRDEDPVRWLWTDTSWRLISQYTAP
ncbi:MAG: hypothetical protein ACF8R7_08575 [Phycisphaerales bacterium JB039]